MGLGGRPPIAEINGANLSVEREQAAPLTPRSCLPSSDGRWLMHLHHVLFGAFDHDGTPSDAHRRGSDLCRRSARFDAKWHDTGPVADRFGCRAALTLSLVIAGVDTILQLPASSFRALAAYRLIAGSAFGGILAASTPWGRALFRKEKRNTVVTMMFIRLRCRAVVGATPTSILIRYGWCVQPESVPFHSLVVTEWRSSSPHRRSGVC
jgi:hypothetical protein